MTSTKPTEYRQGYEDGVDELCKELDAFINKRHDEYLRRATELSARGDHLMALKYSLEADSLATVSMRMRSVTVPFLAGRK